MTTINNLIDQVGGIEDCDHYWMHDHMGQFRSCIKCNKKQMIGGLGSKLVRAIKFNDLRTAIASHREFKVGDWIIDSLIGNSVIRYHDGYKHLPKHYVEAFLRHATSDEIKAGHRIDGELSQ